MSRSPLPPARRADRLRQLPLQQVARQLGYRRDPRNRQRWKRAGSVLSIRGQRFFDHCADRGGGGAIDLVLHARPCSFLQALRFLDSLALQPSACDPPPSGRTDDQPVLPPVCRACWPPVLRHLVRRRRLDPRLLQRTRRQGLLWADPRRNAVFLCRDRHGRPTGAEIAGTRPDLRGRTFKGLAKGTRKRRGGFWLAPPRPRRPACLLLTESAIDALSARLLPLHRPPAAWIASTAGIASRIPAWLPAFPPQAVFCGYDADPPGERAAAALQERHPGIRRLRPPGAKDWNALLLQRGG